MRPIEFRAQNKHNPPNWVFFDIPMIFNVGAGLAYKFDPDPYNGFKNWCQFTGLLDKHGKKIFDGDIVYPGYGENEVFVIVFDESHGRFAEQRCFKGSDIGRPLIMDGSFLYSGKLEIIGNIFENPELLEKP